MKKAKTVRISNSTAIAGNRPRAWVTGRVGESEVQGRSCFRITGTRFSAGISGWSKASSNKLVAPIRADAQ